MKTFITDEIRKESMKSLKRLARIPSFNDEPYTISVPPYGPEIDRALKTVLDLCEELGMKTFRDPEGFYGYADYGEGEETLGVLCHLDVVKAGNLEQWDTDPFKPVEKDGYLYGRGTQDDKGPAISALYAFRAVADEYSTFNRKIRFIFGLDEEHFLRCITRYKVNEVVPTFGFIPDSSFPVVEIEKHLLRAKLIGPGSPNIKLDCGGLFNTVPDVASYTGEKVELLTKVLDSLDASYDVNEDTVTVYGKAVHSKVAAKGTNAIVLLSKGLMSFIPHPTIGFIGEKVGKEADGKNIFGELKDEKSGSLSINIAGLKIEEDHSEISLDMRLPINVEKEKYVEKLKKKIEPFGLEYKEFSYFKPINNKEKNPELMDTLLKIYQDKTGDYSEPVSTGGTTYSRALNNFVAFGARFPDSQDNSHAPNERIRIEEDFYRSMDIYAEAIYRLCVAI